MTRPLSVLLVDSSGEIAGPVLECLGTGSYEVTHQEITDPKSLHGALGNGPWDVVLASCRSSRLTALEALAIVKSERPDLPFIVVSTSPHDVIAAEAMGHGADDSVLLDDLGRLLTAVERGIRRAEESKRQGGRAPEASARYKEYLEGLVQARTLELKHAIQKLMLEVESHRSTVAALRESGEVLEAEVRAKTEELIAAHRQLTDAKRLSDIGNLAATVAHELRNPLSVMQTAIYNIRRKGITPAADKHLENIEKKIHESTQIINNLMSYARIGAPSVRRAGLARVIEQSLASAAAEYGRGRAKIEKDLKAVEGLELEMDPQQIGQAFQNVLSNAYQATPEGGVIKVSAVRDPTAQQVRISITDQGPGIPMDQIDRVFDPFFTTRTHGTGLGLAIAKDILAYHGGQISIRSREGIGTTVTVALPVR